eukprot:222201_1
MQHTMEDEIARLNYQCNEMGKQLDNERSIYSQLIGQLNVQVNTLREKVQSDEACYLQQINQLTQDNYLLTMQFQQNAIIPQALPIETPQLIQRMLNTQNDTNSGMYRNRDLVRPAGGNLNQLKRNTRLCKNWLSKNISGIDCIFGNNCAFAHGEQQLRRMDHP